MPKRRSPRPDEAPFVPEGLPRVAFPDPLKRRSKHTPSGPEQMELRYREIQERLLVRGQHPTKVCEEMSKLYDCTPGCVVQWIKAARERWRALTSKDELVDRQEQLEAMAHNLYEMALGDRAWQGMDELLDELQAAAAGRDKARLAAVVEQLLALRNARRPNLKVAATLIANLGKFYGLGQTLKLDIPGLTLAVAQAIPAPAETTPAAPPKADGEGQ